MPLRPFAQQMNHETTRKTLPNFDIEILFPTNCASWFIDSRSIKTKILEMGTIINAIYVDHSTLLYQRLLLQLYYLFFLATRRIFLTDWPIRGKACFLPSLSSISSIFVDILSVNHHYFIIKHKEVKHYSLRDHIQILLLVLTEF